MQHTQTQLSCGTAVQQATLYRLYNRISQDNTDRHRYPVLQQSNRQLFIVTASKQLSCGTNRQFVVITKGSARATQRQLFSHNMVSQGNTDRHSYLVHSSPTGNSMVTMDKPGQHRQTIKAALWHSSRGNTSVTMDKSGQHRQTIKAALWHS